MHKSGSSEMLPEEFLERMKRIVIAVLVVMSATAAFGDDWQQQFASLGDFRLESGDVLRNCRIGYRTAGTLDANRSNAILLTTWFAGSTSGLKGWVGPGQLFDTTKYYIIGIDALGDAVSSSPSNSPDQPREKFPRFTVRDMVRTQQAVLTRELKLERLFAVAGLSMGGMQTFEWVISYPEFARKAIAIVGTPRQTGSDLVLWKTELDLLESFQPDAGAMRKAMDAIAGIQALELRTPSWLAKNVTDASRSLAEHRKSLGGLDPYDYMAQLRAMIAHDIYRDFDGDVARVAKAIKTRMLVVVSLQDEMVNPAPARELARAAGSEIMTLTGDCGHLASGCEREILQREVWRFLAE